jgi:phosphohistidine phosphatase
MPIDVYFIRHGIAADPAEYDQDRDRPLVAKGRKKTAAVAQRLREIGLHFDEILTSPLVRAQQTAEILLERGLTSQLTVTESLSPDGGFQDWLTWLKTWQSPEHCTVALVGHQPDLGQWAERLVWGDAQQKLVLKKAGIIGVTVPDNIDPVGNSVLFWLTPPRYLMS